MLEWDSKKLISWAVIQRVIRVARFNSEQPLTCDEASPAWQDSFPISASFEEFVARPPGCVVIR